jgi:hypothetical protein
MAAWHPGLAAALEPLHAAASATATTAAAHRGVLAPLAAAAGVCVLGWATSVALQTRCALRRRRPACAPHRMP